MEGQAEKKKGKKEKRAKEDGGKNKIKGNDKILIMQFVLVIQGQVQSMEDY
jgi:hypothetical protein